MRPSFRLLTPRLNPFSTTGLAGILTHPHPRPTLIAIYKHTLDVLSRMPAHSIYRQSTENLTRERLSLLENTKPDGWNEYIARVKKEPGLPEIGVYMRRLLSEFSEASDQMRIEAYCEQQLKRWEGVPLPAEVMEREEGEEGYEVLLEPQLSAEQVAELEAKLDEGLIEEAVEQGWNELECAKVMEETKVWDPLEVQPAEGQWVAFERTPASGAGAA